jgi:hypothetical protein
MLLKLTYSALLVVRGFRARTPVAAQRKDFVEEFRQ